MCIGWQNSGLESQDKKNITLLGGRTLQSLIIVLFILEENIYFVHLPRRSTLILYL